MEKGNWECSMCAMCGRHHWLGIVIKIAVALIVFWCGVQFGELKAMLHSNYFGYRMMNGYGDGKNMMYGFPGAITKGCSAVPSQSTTSTTTKKK